MTAAVEADADHDAKENDKKRDFDGKIHRFDLLSFSISAGDIGSLLAWVVLGRRTRVMTQHLDSATMPEFFDSTVPLHLGQLLQGGQKTALAVQHRQDHRRDAHQHDDALDEIVDGGGDPGAVGIYVHFVFPGAGLQLHLDIGLY